MQTLEDDAKARFRMKRYMDDVITVTAKDDSAWDVDRFRVGGFPSFWSRGHHLPSRGFRPLEHTRARIQQFFATTMDRQALGAYLAWVSRVREPERVNCLCES